MPFTLQDVGSEFLVNTRLRGQQQDSTVLALPDGGFAIVWKDQPGDVNGPEFNVAPRIVLRFYNEDGTPRTGEITVRTGATLSTAFPPRYEFLGAPEAIVLANGDLAISWRSTDGNERLQIVDSLGQAVGNMIALPVPESNITADPAGGIIAAWLDDTSTLRYQSFDASGSATSPAVVISPAEHAQPFDGRITVLSDGARVAVWSNRTNVSEAISNVDVYAQRFDASGQPIGDLIGLTEVPFNPGAVDSQSDARLVELSNGNLLVVWRDGTPNAFDADGSVQAQLLTHDGARLGSAFIINTTVTGPQGNAKAIAVPGGGFLIVWDEQGQSISDVRAQLFAADGSKIGVEYIINNFLQNPQTAPAMAVLANGDAAISWTDFSRLGGDTTAAVRAQVLRLVGDAPQPDVALSSFTVPENAAGGTSVATLTATGPLSAATATFTLIDDAGGRFQLVNGNEIVVAPGAMIDYEAIPAHQVTVRVDDGNGVVFDKVLNLLVEDQPGENVAGGAAGDTLITSTGNDTIAAGEGDNFVSAGLGDDVVTAGTGNDTIAGGGGNNEIAAGDGNNVVSAGGGNDTITAGTGNDAITSGDGNDVVASGGGSDTIVGGTGAGDDVYDAGTGTDTAIFSSANQGIIVDLRAADRSAQPSLGGSTIGQLLTAAGYAPDTAVGYSEGVDIGTDALIGFENVVAGAGSDQVWGDAGDNRITGGRGDDSIDGGGGTDTAIYAGARSDYVVSFNGASGAYIVSDAREGNPDGSDALTGIETVEFAGGDAYVLADLVPAGMTVDKVVTGVFNPDGSADEDGSVEQVGDRITYGITLTNTGDTALTGIVVNDPLVADLTFTGGDIDGDNALDMGEVWTYTASYAITQDNLDNNGTFDNRFSPNSPYEVLAKDSFESQFVALTLDSSARISNYLYGSGPAIAVSYRRP